MTTSIEFACDHGDIGVVLRAKVSTHFPILLAQGTCNANTANGPERADHAISVGFLCIKPTHVVSSDP